MVGLISASFSLEYVALFNCDVRVFVNPRIFGKPLETDQLERSPAFDS